MSEQNVRCKARVATTLVSSAIAALVVCAAASAQQQPRGYELVSPADKNGYPVYWSTNAGSVGMSALSRDGDAAIFMSFGLFAGAENGMPQTYRATREEHGWLTRTVTPRTVSVIPNPSTLVEYNNFWRRTTPDLDVGLLRTRDTLNPGDRPFTVDAYVSGVDGVPRLASRGTGDERVQDEEVVDEAISDDGRRAYFTTDAQLVPGDEHRSYERDLYERFGDRTTLLNQWPDGSLINRCGSVLGSDHQFGTGRNAVSQDGGVVVFSVPGKNPSSGPDPDCFRPRQIYARTGDGTIIHVSAPRRTLAEVTQDAWYEGASADGTRIIFRSQERLLDGLASGGIYIYDVVQRSLRLAIASSDAAVFKNSDDGRTIYIHSYEALAPGSRSPGTPSLYVYREDERGNATISWVVDDVAFDLMVYSAENSREAHISRDGNELAFSTAGGLTSFDAADPVTGLPTRQVYVYDGDSVRCVSCDVAGQRPPGSRVLGSAKLATDLNGLALPRRSISEDGSRVFFESPDRLVAGDTNSRVDVYEYSGGRVQLISSGSSLHDSYLVDSSSSGETVMFATFESLVPEDVDGGNLDMYVSRVGGGFFGRSEAPADLACDGDACQGTPTPAPPDDAPGSAQLLAGPDDQPLARPRVGAMRPTRRALRALAMGRRAALLVRATDAGVVRLVLTARLSGRVRTIAGGRVRSRRGTPTVRVPVRLTPAARAALRRRRRLAVTMRANYVGQTGGSTVTFVLKAVAPRSRGALR